MSIFSRLQFYLTIRACLLCARYHARCGRCEGQRGSTRSLQPEANDLVMKPLLSNSNQSHEKRATRTSSKTTLSSWPLELWVTAKSKVMAENDKLRGKGREKRQGREAASEECSCQANPSHGDLPLCSCEEPHLTLPPCCFLKPPAHLFSPLSSATENSDTLVHF